MIRKSYFLFLEQGLPPTANMLLVAIGMFIITYHISPFDKHTVAAYGVFVRIEQIFLLPSIGINVAVLSIVSQNNGAKYFSRVNETVYLAQKIGIVIWLIGIFFIYLFGEHMMSFFETPLIFYWWNIVLVIWCSAIFMLWYAKKRVKTIKPIDLLDFR